MSLQTRPREDLVKMLDENHHLILQIADLQNKGRAGDCHVVQKHLLKNLLYLGTLANEQIKTEELQLSPSTRSNLRTQAKPSHLARLPIATLDTDKYLKASEALPTAAQHRARIVTCAAQETPVAINTARPRRLQPTIFESSAPTVPWIRVEVPTSTNSTAESITTIPLAAGVPLQRSIALTAPQAAPIQSVQSQRWSHEAWRGGYGVEVQIEVEPYPSLWAVSPQSTEKLLEAASQCVLEGTQIEDVRQVYQSTYDQPAVLFDYAFLTRSQIPQISSISPRETVRYQTTIPASTSSAIVTPTGQILQLQNPVISGEAARLGGPMIIPVSTAIGAPQEQAPHSDSDALVQTNVAVPVQQYIATMTPQGMVLVPMKTIP